MAEPEPEISEEQAASALRQLVNNAIDDPDGEVSAASVLNDLEQPAEVVAGTKDTPETPPETTETTDSPEPVVEATPETPEAVPEVEAAEDDVASLQQRTKRLEEKVVEAEKRADSRIEAIKQRESQSSRILRDRMLRKSTLTDKALQILRRSRSQDGVPEADVDRLISEMEGSMNPASANYAPPETYQQNNGGAASSEDQVLVLNEFLNERGMTSEESDEFGKWVRNEASTAMSPTEQAVAQESLNGFLHLAHSRWNESVKQKAADTRSDTVNVVKSVQQTQKAVARAASATTSAPKKSSISPQSQEIDVTKLTEEQVSALIRKSSEQYM